MGNGEKQNTQLAIQTQQVKALKVLLDSKGIRAEIERALPAGMVGDRLIGLAVSVYRTTPQLWECDLNSIARCVIEAAGYGLELTGVLGQAYLVPFYNKKTGKKEAVLLIGYRGHLTLAYRSGMVSNIYPCVVYEGDEFEISQGTDRYIRHKPRYGQKRGEAIGAYAVVFYKDGVKDFEFMTKDEIEEVRDTYSKAYNAGADSVWTTRPLAKWEICPIRKLAKRMPQTPQFREFVQAAIADEYREAGIQVQAIDIEAAVVNGPQAQPENDAQAIRLKDDCEKLMDLLGYNEAQKEMAWSTYQGAERLGEFLLKLKHDLDARNAQILKDQQAKKGKAKAAPPEQGSFEEGREPGEEG